MHKTEFVNALMAKTELKKADVVKLVDAYSEVVMEALEKGDNVRLIGFGTFSVSERAARTGRNPHTGAALEIPASRGARFTASRNFKEKLNAK